MLELDSPVKLGSMLFTLVEPRRGHEVAYNRWYERDHFYAGCMIGPWLFAGRRWVATRALKALRFPDDSPVAVPLAAGSYLAIYWVHAGYHDEHFDWAGDQVKRLYASGRGFAERTHVHTALYDFAGAVYRDADPVPVELALDHGHAGLAVVVLERAASTPADELDAWLRERALPDALAGSAIACAASWSPHPAAGGPTESAPMDLGSPAGGPERRLQLLFLDDEPQKCWDAVREHAARVEADGRARVALAAPFLPTRVGTDLYTDQLW